MRDYLGAAFVQPKDKVDHGVKGMKWGVRRPRSVLRKEAAKRQTTTTAPVKKASDTNPDGSESSAGRYNRLAAQAKAGGASTMSDTDLKFFNARTEALSKINKITQEEPGWLSKTAKKVVQQTAERQMQSVADSLADKYVGKPITDAIKGKAVEAAVKTKKD